MIPMVGPMQGAKTKNYLADAKVAAVICFRREISGLGGSQHLRGDQSGKRVFLGAEALQQCSLFFRSETIPDLDHLFSSADQSAGLGFAEIVGHGSGLYRSGCVESATFSAFHTVWVAHSVFVVSLAAFNCFFGLGLLGAGLLRGCLLSLVQAWEGEIRYLVHRRRSSQGLFLNRW
jgi:hypothetical protein